jgi:hypothetical protein
MNTSHNQPTSFLDSFLSDTAGVLALMFLGVVGYVLVQFHTGIAILIGLLLAIFATVWAVRWKERYNSRQAMESHFNSLSGAFSQLERDTLFWIHESCQDPQIQAQIRSCRPRRRLFDNGSLVVELEVSKEAPKVTNDQGENVLIKGPAIDSPRLFDGAGSMALVEDGFLRRIEFIPGNGRFPRHLLSYQLIGAF